MRREFSRINILLQGGCLDLNFNTEIRKILFNPILGKLIVLTICFIIIYLLNKSAKRYIFYKITDSVMRYRTKKMLSFVGSVLFIVTAGFIFSDKLGGLTVAFGVAGAGVAFALQEVIASVAGWFAITFNNFFRVGDRVQLGGIKGDVIDIGVLRTTLMEIGDWINGDLYNGRTVRISNSFVFKDPVFNYSAEYPFLWDEISIVIRHESDDVEAEKIIKECAEQVVGGFEKGSKLEWNKMVQKFMIEDARVENFLSLTVDGNGLHYTLRYVTDYKTRRKTKDQLFRKIHQKFKSSSGRVEWAVTTLELSSRSALEWQIRQS